MTTAAEMERWAGEAERLHALATSGTVGAEMAAATLRLRGVEYVGALIAAVAAERARCAAVCRARAVEYERDPDGSPPRTGDLAAEADGCAEAIERGPSAPGVG